MPATALDPRDAREDVKSNEDYLAHLNSLDRPDTSVWALERTRHLATIEDTLKDASTVFNEALKMEYWAHEAEIEHKIIVFGRKCTKLLDPKHRDLKVKTLDLLIEMRKRHRESAINPLGVALTFKNAMLAFESNVHGDHLSSVAELIDDNKIIHANQLQTAASILFKLLLNPGKSGTVIGAVQSGKTGTAMGVFIFIAPIFYTLTGVRILPLFVSTNQKSHVKQAKRTLTSLVKIYGDVEVKMFDIVGEEDFKVGDYYFTVASMMRDEYAPEVAKLNAVKVTRTVNYLLHPNLKNYCSEVIGEEWEDLTDEMIFIRTPGAAKNQFRDKLRKADRNGIGVWMLVDEPQFGSSGDISTDHDPEATNLRGEATSGCILRRLLQDFEELIHDENCPHRFVGFSATPFGMTNLPEMWNVRARLAPNYVGFNCYDGSPIDPSVPLLTPKIIQFDHLQTVSRDAAMIPELFCVSKRCEKFLYRHGIPTVEEARRRAGVALFQVFMANYGTRRWEKGRNGQMVEVVEIDTTKAAVLRLTNDNTTTDAIIRDAALDDNWQIVHFYDDTNKGLDVEDLLKILSGNDPKVPFLRVPNLHGLTIGEIIAQSGTNGIVNEWEGLTLSPAQLEQIPPTYLVTRDNDKPVLIVVSGKARMGDVFPYKGPISVRLFFDCTQKPADINAAIQSLPARASGVDKFDTTVFLRPKYAEMINNYVRSMGKDTGQRAPRHNIYADAVESPDGGRSKIMRLGYNESGKHPRVKAFIEDVTKEIVAKRYPGKLAGLRGSYRPATTEYVPLLKLAAKHDILHLITDPVQQKKLFPKMQFMKVVKPGETLDQLRPKEVLKLIRRGMHPVEAERVSTVTLRWPFQYVPEMLSVEEVMAGAEYANVGQARDGSYVLIDDTNAIPDGVILLGQCRTEQAEIYETEEVPAFFVRNTTKGKIGEPKLNKDGSPVLITQPKVGPDGRAIWHTITRPVMVPKDTVNIDVACRHISAALASSENDQTLVGADRATVDSRDSRLQKQMGMDWVPTFNIQISCIKVDDKGSEIADRATPGRFIATAVYFPLHEVSDYDYMGDRPELLVVSNSALDKAHDEESRRRRDEAEQRIREEKEAKRRRREARAAAKAAREGSR